MESRAYEWRCNRCGHEFEGMDAAGVDIAPDSDERAIACPKCWANNIDEDGALSYISDRMCDKFRAFYRIGSTGEPMGYQFSAEVTPELASEKLGGVKVFTSLEEMFANERFVRVDNGLCGPA